MLRELIREGIAKALKSANYSLPIAEIEVTRTSDPKFGDFSTNIALKINRKVKQSPMETAKKLSDSLMDLPYVEKLEVVGPGFINFWIKTEVWQKEVSSVLKEKEKFGSNALGRGKKARIEFVSANPTGPLHFGNARGGPIGDALSSVLEFCSYKVVREYYHNDIGEQVRKLGESIINVSGGQKLEDQEYKGTYVSELARKIGKAKDSNEAGKKAVDMLLAEILKDCRDMGIRFDQVYPESEFASSGETKSDIDHLREKGVLKEKEGA